MKTVNGDTPQFDGDEMFVNVVGKMNIEEANRELIKWTKSLIIS